MAVLHDWKCAKHGVFESTHAICPHLGCDSSKVEMVFLKAPGIRSAKTSHFDKGIRQTAEQMGLPNLRSGQHAGDTAFGGEHAGKMLWGDDAMRVTGGFQNIVQQSTMAEQATGVPSGMRMAAQQSGITRNKLPPATITPDPTGQGMKGKA